MTERSDPCWNVARDGHSDPTCPVVREQARTAAIAERLLASTRPTRSNSLLANDPDIAALVKAGAFREAMALALVGRKKPVEEAS